MPNYGNERSLFVLSGENSTIPSGELEALVETYSSNSKISKISRRIALVEGNINTEEILKRSAYVKLGGLYLGSINNSTEENLRKIEFNGIERINSFAARVYNISNQKNKLNLEAELGHIVKEKFPTAKVSLKAPETLIIGIISEDGFHICGVDSDSIRRSWRERRPRARPFFHPSALYSKFARLLVNLSHVRGEDILLDPFCGTGSILIESAYIGIRSIGIDISRKMCEGSMSNYKHFNLSKVDIIMATANSLPVAKVDGIATDIPYGRVSSTHKQKVNCIAENIVNTIATILPKGKFACIVHPEVITLPKINAIEKVQEHKIYIHRSLTRVITLLKHV